MDPGAFKKRRVAEDNEEDKSLGQQTEAEKYACCERFTFKCPNKACRTDIKIESPFAGAVSKIFKEY
jgi:hypothetical protein